MAPDPDVKLTVIDDLIRDVQPPGAALEYFRAMGRKRWAGSTPGERKAHGLMMQKAKRKQSN